MGNKALQEFALLHKMASPTAKTKMKENYERMGRVLQGGVLSPANLGHMARLDPRLTKHLIAASVIGAIGHGIAGHMANVEAKRNAEAKEAFRKDLLAKYGEASKAESEAEGHKYEEARKDKEDQKNWEREKFKMTEDLQRAEHEQRRKESQLNRDNQMSIARMKASQKAAAAAPSKNGVTQSEEDDYKKKSNGFSRSELLKIAQQKFKNPEDVKDYVSSYGKAKIKKESGSFLTKLPVFGKVAKMAGIKGNDSYTIDRKLPKARE